jgi:hypothetical protein
MQFRHALPDPPALAGLAVHAEVLAIQRPADAAFHRRTKKVGSGWPICTSN